MSGTFRDIPALLHDARLVDCRWDRHLGTLTLCFECLRRNVDGTPVEDRTVDLRLSGVERITAYYSPADVFVKPSEFRPDSRFVLADIEDWHYGPVEAHLAINSPQVELEAATACVQETLAGGPEVHAGVSPLKVHVSFEPHNDGPKAASSSLCIDCDSIEPLANGIPLDIETWQSQFEAWWAGWREHWSAKDQDDPGEQEPALEDTLIPLRQPDPPDLSYRPPLAAPFLLTHPKNFRRSWLHARDYGLLVANPFGRNAFTQGEKSRVTVKKGEELRLRFGVLVYEGESPKIGDAHWDYVGP